MPKDGLQLFQLQGRGDAEHAAVTIETAVRHQDVGVGIKSKEVAKALHSNNGAGDGIVFRYCILEKNLQGFPGAAAEIGKKLPIVEEVTAEDLGEADPSTSSGRNAGGESS